MPITFSVKKFTYSDSKSDAQLETTIKTDLDAANITTVYSTLLIYKNGFYHLTVIYA